jgi:D-serine deaminase-like pyridoxal phosphate-dependent protein
VRQLFADLPAAERAPAAARVTFLVDTRARLEELVALASSLALTLQVGVEIDVGLHRGGVRWPSGLPEVLAGFTASPGAVRFSGMLGYDGHIPSTPVAPGLKIAGMRAAYRAVEESYRAFVDVVKADYPSLWRDDLRWNSGGSATYPLHHGGVVNDVAAGGGMLRPAAYPDTLISALTPALFIAAPVLAHFDAVEIPFVTRPAQSLLAGEQSFTIYGGGWAAVFVWPLGVGLAPLVSDPENENLVPNETLLVAPSSPAIGPGDWVFQHPRLADALFQFEEILLVRGGRLQADRFRAYPRRY